MKILIIGGGTMGQAITKCLQTSVSKIETFIVEQDDDTRLKVKELTNNIFRNVDEALSSENKNEYEVIILAVKPSAIKSASKNIKKYLNKESLVISIAAGVSTAKIEDYIGKIPVVRAMPNLAATVGESATAICAGGHADANHIDLAQQLVLSISQVVVVDEEQMNIVTALSGSGPAYFYLLTQYLIDAASEKGLDEDIARILGEQTLIGAARTLNKEPDNVEELRIKVTSPGGTTQAAIEDFESNDLASLVKSAVNAAFLRAEELG